MKAEGRGASQALEATASAVMMVSVGHSRNTRRPAKQLRMGLQVRSILVPALVAIGMSLTSGRSYYAGARPKARR